MSHLKHLLTMLALLGLAACGGGGGSAGTPPFGGSGSATDLALVLSAPSIVNTGSGSVTATVTALDANRNVVPGIAVTISADSGAIVTPSGTTTDSTGKVTATITLGADRSNRNITITARSGSVERTATLQVVSSGGSAVAADLNLVLSGTSLTNGGGGATIRATATAVDQNRNAVAGIPVTISVDSNAVAQVSGAVTNAAGVVTADIGIGSDRTNRVITVTATSGSLTRTATFVVTGAKLTSSSAPLVVAGSKGNVVEYTLVDFNALAMAGQSISVSTGATTAVTGTTDLNGKYRFVYDAPVDAGTLTIVATAAGDTKSDLITISGGTGGVVPIADVTPQSASITPSPSVVTVNSPGSTTNQVELRALFLGPDNKPIPRVRVRFDLAGNSNSTDGTVNFIGTYAYSDANGVARATFTPGLRDSPTNGVTVRACYDVGDFAFTGSGCDGAGSSVRFVTNTLTVTKEALSVSIRTNREIKTGGAGLTYIKEFVVLVVDSAGVAKPGVVITPSVDLPNYYKGEMEWDGQKWSRERSIMIKKLADTEHYVWDAATRTWAIGNPNGDTIPRCPNEDVNRNAVREADAFVPGDSPPLTSRNEDMNWNGSLDPRKADVAIKMIDTNVTDTNGLARLQIEYGKSLATWVDFIITVTASGISGTEARALYLGLSGGLGPLPIAADEITSETNPPAAVISPYGVASVCTNPN